jgi:hypothetical protein
MGDRRNARKPRNCVNAVAEPPPPSPPPRPKPRPRKRQPEAPSQDGPVSVIITRPPRPKSKPAGVDSQSIIQDILSAGSSEKNASVSEIGSGEVFEFDGLSGSDDEDEEEIDDDDELALPHKPSKKPQSRAAGNGTFIPFQSFPHISYSMHSETLKIVRNSF